MKEHMNPIQKYLKNLFAKKRVLGNDAKLTGLAKADAILTSLVNEEKVPGISVTVLKKGEIVLQKGYGHADLEKKIPVHPKKTIFRIASVSKPIAATALAQMVADGQIDLDASLYTYVPYYPRKTYDFTIRQLASHTAGIRGYRGIEYGLNKPYSIKQGINVFKDDDLLFEPGTDYFYTSYDWVLISLAMQEISRIPFEDYVREKVLSPLGMKNTFVPNVNLGTVEGFSDGKAASNTLDLTAFYSKNRKGFRKAIPVNNFFKMAGGGYLSTSDDIAKFGQTYLDGKILFENVLSQFLTSVVVKGTPTYYGLGWQVSQDKKGRPFYGHVGNGVGGYSNFFVYPEQQMVFAILVNCTSPNIQMELDEVIDTLLVSCAEES
ncbi:serine hydrolase domain-containing protein [Kriegella aquimaris]|uniref:CubicO group peptidase, beta-lactamase class C family n=1 Tax=Kriegella aquimaris TaxID=192904 RepID=A0A1G9PS84_9FLAO|nr:serine hydrolase domain-containing protein [Kriegella aquimaris]SDM01579.1 CubicO group peptidase, beta-lactamase class C family [Kriegella aquimaris]